MIALLQRVNYASVRIEGELQAQIGAGLVVFLGLERNDDLSRGQRLLRRVLDYRVFGDEQGRMNRSLRDCDAELLLVSQFTLAADTGRGLRPGFSTAMAPAAAEALYDQLVDFLRIEHPRLATGRFAADMKVLLENDGPVTFTLCDRPTP